MMHNNYDSVEWPFLKFAMRELGRPTKMIGWIMTCINSVSYSILVNWARMKPFHDKEGLGQGDVITILLDDDFLLFSHDIPILVSSYTLGEEKL